MKMTLPSTLEGAWRVEVLVVDPPSGDLHAIGADTVVVGRDAGVYLRLNRPIANSFDTIRATLRTVAGATPRKVRLLAWLHTPDGRLLGLPRLLPNELNLSHGAAQTEEIQLFRSFPRTGGDRRVPGAGTDVRLGDAQAPRTSGRRVRGVRRAFQGDGHRAARRWQQL